MFYNRNAFSIQKLTLQLKNRTVKEFNLPLGIHGYTDTWPKADTETSSSLSNTLPLYSNLVHATDR